MRPLKIGLSIVVLLVLVGGGAFWFMKRPALVSAIDENNLPKFIQADFVDLDRIVSVSKFRSGVGHNFASKGESCRSMKHYFMPVYDATAPQITNETTVFPAPDPATAIDIYSPVDGAITAITEEQMPIGKQVSIVPDAEPSFTIRLFHVYLIDGVEKGSKVTAGQKIGIIGKSQQTDIAVQTTTLKGPQYVSYFQVMPDALVANYLARGAKSRNDFIITKEERDAQPLQCTGRGNEEFVPSTTSTAALSDEVHLTGYVDPQAEYDKQFNNGQSTSSQDSSQSSTQSTSTPTSDTGSQSSGSGSGGGSGAGGGGGNKSKSE